LDKGGDQLFIWSADEPAEARGVSLPSLPDELRIADRLALITLEGDAVTAVDLRTGQVTALRQLDQLLTPPANGPEDLIVAPDEPYVVVSFQKDSKSGEKKGNRLVLFRLPDMRVVADLQLPRDHPDLHIADNPKEQGPGPEVLYIAPESDTLAITLDLYGALGIMRWSAAKTGRIEDWTVIGTAADDRLTGQSFPDRATALRLANRDYYLVCNAGTEGGAVLVDLQTKQVRWRRPTPAGLEAPVYIPALRQVFSVCSGKTKQREGQEVIRSFHPQSSLFGFDFRSRQAVQEGPVQQWPLGGLTTQIALVSEQPPLLLVALGQEPERADTLLTFDPVSGTVKDQVPAVGVIGRFEH
jgi:hypothetical protein